MITKAILFVEDQEKDDLIDVEEAVKMPKETLFKCPMCYARVMPKMYDDRTSHFAHYHAKDCGATDEMVDQKFTSSVSERVEKMSLI